MTPLTIEQKSELRELYKKATPIPWATEFPTGRDTQWLDIVAGPDGVEILHADTEPLPYWMKDPEGQKERIDKHKVNLELAAAAVNSVPALLAENERLERELAEARQHVETHIEDWHRALDQRDSAREQRDKLGELLEQARARILPIRHDSACWCFTKADTSLCSCGALRRILEAVKLDAEIQSTLAALEKEKQG